MTIAQNLASKFAVAFVAVAMILMAFAPAVRAEETAEDLQATINSLLAQVADLQGQLGDDEEADAETTSSASCESIPAPLTVGSQGASVTALQNRLIADGQAIAAGATGYFGAQTKAALAAWQAANNVSPAAGYYGPITMAAMDAACVPADEDEDTDEDTTDEDMELSGEGTLDDTETELDDSSDNEVMEGEEDAEIATLTLAAEDGDIEVSRLDFSLADASGTDNEADLWDTFETISLWVDGENIGEFEADDEDNYLDEDDGTFRISGLEFVINEDEEVDITVAATVMGAVDGSDTDGLADWDLDVTDIRYFDADGVASDDNISGNGTVTFDVVEEGTDDGASIGSNSSNPDATTLLVDDSTDESDEYVVHVFDIEVDEDSSDLEVGDVLVDVTVTNANPAAAIAGGQEEVISDIYMTIDGVEVKGEATTNGTDDEDTAITLNGGDTEVEYLFEFDQDVVLEGDETYEAEISVVLEGQDGNYVNGVTIETAVDGTTWEVEGLANDDELDGTDSSETHTLADVVPVISDGEFTVDRNEAGDAGTISYEFTVEADGENDVDLTFGDVDAVDGTADDVRFALTGTDTTIAAATISKVGGDATATGSTGWAIADGDEATFVLDVTFTTVDAADNGTYRVTVDTIDGVEIDETSSGMSLTN